MFAVLIGACAIHKVIEFEFRTALQSYCLLPMFGIWLVVEPFRIYYGFSGNLKEKIIFPVDITVSTIMLAFLSLTAVLGFLTIRRLLRFQTSQFMRLADDGD
eukprot:gene8007-16390_t